MKPILKIKRVYDQPSKLDGYRILVDRLWPRGVTKEDASLHAWLKSLAPSTSLRKWFNHDPELWQEFIKKYKAELKKNKAILEFLETYGHIKKITLVYAALDKEHTHALVLMEFLEEHYEKAGKEYHIVYTHS